ncbi:MAG: Ig-like domain repeat protein [Aeromicrobium sp.]|nr:Ig-like domain repeat protein [Burkholderiales bacterium]
MRGDVARVGVNNIYRSLARWGTATEILVVLLGSALMLLASPSVNGQQTTTTSVVSNKNPSRTLESVTLTATVQPVRVSADFRFALTVGSPQGSTRYLRFSFDGARFAGTVLPSQLTVPGNPGGLSSVAVVQGGTAGASFVLFQIIPAAPGLRMTDIVKFVFPTLELFSTSTTTSVASTVSFSVHESLTSGCCAAAPNTSLIFQGTPVGVLTFVSAAVPSGAVSFKSDGVVLPGCGALPLTAGVVLCTTGFPNVGLQTVTAEYAGDMFFSASVGTLAGGQQVSAGGSASATLRSSRSAATLGDRVFLTVSILGNSLAGRVTFTEPAAVASIRTLCENVLITANGDGANAVCEVPAANRTVGTHVFTAVFTGDAGSASTSASVEQVIYNGLQALLLRSDEGRSLVGTLNNGQLQFIAVSDPGPDFRLLQVADLDGNTVPDLIFQNLRQGESGDVRVWKDASANADRTLRSVKLTWRLEAVGDLDGDGFGDIVWRFTGQSPNADDTGVSYVWFTDGSDVTRVRKRGGAPLSWQLLGAVDINADRAADMIYVSPEQQLRVLVATAGRTCANFAAGSIPAGFVALKAGDFTGSKRGEILIRELATGQNRILVLDGTSLILPPPTANPDDPNAACTPTTQAIQQTVRPLATADASWRLFATADLNGDGILDLIWLKPGGILAVWLLAPNAGAPIILENAGVLPVGFVPVNR